MKNSIKILQKLEEFRKMCDLSGANYDILLNNLINTEKEFIVRQIERWSISGCEGSIGIGGKCEDKCFLYHKKLSCTKILIISKWFQLNGSFDIILELKDLL